MRAFLLLASTLAFGTMAQAGCIGTVISGSCYGTYVDNPRIGSSSDSGGYKGSSGTKYDYDLSRPSDRNRYNLDLDAQRRDSLSLSPGRSLDRGLGQFGGGISN